MIDANKDMLKHIWINLIDNAVKFSPEGSMVEISVKLKDGIYIVNISNQGPEITSEQQKRIFNEFYQADESHSSEGNGIGLALVKNISELHNGAVSVSSKKGVTVFTVRLPQKQH